MIESLQYRVGDNLIPKDVVIPKAEAIRLLKNSDFQETYPTMKAFPKAIQHKFNNGHAKDFCQEMSFLCGQDLCKKNYGSVGPRDTFVDGFKLQRYKQRVKKPSTSMLTKSQSQNSAVSSSGSRCSSEHSSHSSTHYASGNCTADFMVLSTISMSPLVMFECKSDELSTRDGWIQLVSHGLALQHKKQILHELKLVLITPLFWCTASLPAFDLDKKYLKINFVNFHVFQEDDNGYINFNRNEYIAFLRDIRQQFKSVKLVK